MERVAGWGAAILVLAFLPVWLSHAEENPTRKIQSAISHRCVLECAWVKERCIDGGQAEARCRDEMSLCRRGCMAPEAVKKAMKSSPPRGWGETKKDAIEVCLPSGQHSFLADLQCPDGKAPRYHRVGSVGSRNPMPEEMDFKPSLMDPTYRLKKGEVDYHVVDKYEVACSEKTHTLFFDMYHCGDPKPWKAPRGFTRPPRG